jgi:hypothetical protein
MKRENYNQRKRKRGRMKKGRERETSLVDCATKELIMIIMASLEPAKIHSHISKSPRIRYEWKKIHSAAATTLSFSRVT